MQRLPMLALSILTASLASGLILDAQQGATTLARATPAPAPRLSVHAPIAAQLANGIAIIRFEPANIVMASLFVAAANDTIAPKGHLHVTVDGASWHWVHSTTDPIVVAPLSPGEHTVTLELAAADHRPLDTRTVRFTVPVKLPSPEKHSGHR